SLPICGSDDRLHGIITDRDIVVKCIATGGDPRTTTAMQLAQEKVVWVDANADENEALRLMEQHQIRRLPVIDNGRLVGIISTADVARRLDDGKVAEFAEKVYAAR